MTYVHHCVWCPPDTYIPVVCFVLFCFVCYGTFVASSATAPPLGACRSVLFLFRMGCGTAHVRLGHNSLLCSGFAFLCSHDDDGTIDLRAAFEAGLLIEWDKLSQQIPLLENRPDWQEMTRKIVGKAMTIASGRCILILCDFPSVPSVCQSDTLQIFQPVMDCT